MQHRTSPGLLMLLLIGCSSSHPATPDAGGRAGTDGSVVLMDSAVRPRLDAGVDAWREPDGGPSRRDGAVPEPAPGEVVCGARVCEPGLECCTLTLECFDPADSTACVVPDAEMRPGACASSVDCAPDELCGRDGPSAACGGAVGRCIARVPAGGCESTGPVVCGCDGRTYRDPCAAVAAGVRVAWQAPCGASTHYTYRVPCDASHTICSEGWHCDVEAGWCVEDRPLIVCGIDAQCPEGSSCCGVVGVCFPADCPECCFVPPAGTWYPCHDDEDCVAFEESATPSGEFYCDGEGCGTPGGCAWREHRCGGELEPVCGCNGTSYANPCWASEAGVRVAHEGACP